MNTLGSILKQILCLGVLLFVIAGTANAWDWDNSMERELFERIDAARRNPVKELRSQGLNVSKWRTCHPELAEWIADGFNPLLPDTRLFKSATAHAIDMATEGYFSKISINGDTIEDRFAFADFYASTSNEAIGIVLFQNYLPREKAMLTLWKGMLQNELNCSEQPESIIFNPEFTEIGVGVQSGSMTLNGMNLNFYLAVCDFGQDRVQPKEKEMFLSVNQVRSEWVVETAESDETISDPSVNKLAPFRSDIRLMDMARILAESALIDDSGEDEIAPVLPLKRRLSDMGYAARMAAETTKMWITVDVKSDEELREYFMDYLMSHESNLPEGQKVLLNKTLTDAGGYILSREREHNNSAYYVHVLSLVAAMPSKKKETYVCTGIVTSALDVDLSGLLLQVSGSETDQYIFTGRSGDFSIELLPGEYVIRMAEIEENIGLDIPESNFIIADRNVYVSLGFSDIENMAETVIDIDKIK